MSRSEQLADDIRKGAWWRDRAACSEVGTDVFFDKGLRSQALALCQVCPVNNCCLDYALKHEPEFGVYGGFTAAQRSKYRRELTHYVRGQLREGVWGAVTILGRNSAL